MNIRALLTGGFAAALAVAAFAAPPGPAVAAAAPHSPAGSPGTNPLTTADFTTRAGGIAVGGVAGVLPARGTGSGAVGAPAPAVASPAASCSEPNCNLPYHNGVVQHAPRVYLLFWGPKWKTNATHKAVENYLIAFYKGLGRTPKDGWSLIDAQYGDKTGHPTFGRSLLAGVHVLATTPPKTVTLADLGNEAATAAQNIFKVSLANLHNAQIVIASQSGTCFAASGGLTFAGNCGKTTVGYCAFHNFDSDQSNASIYLPWVNLPFELDARQGCGENFVNSGSRGKMDGFSVSGGHETAETITDPKETAWVDKSDNISGGEIADKCAWAGSAWGQNPPDPAGDIALTTGSFAVQSLWSNIAHRCALSDRLPFRVTHLRNQSGTIGKALSIQVSAATSPAVRLTFRAAGLPDGLSISRAGKITGSPNVTAGTFFVKITVSYYAGSTSFRFTWKISSAPGQVTGPSAKCVDDALGHTGSGNKIDVFACDGKAQQRITFAATGELRVLGKCVAGPLKALLEPCKLVTSQLWTRHANGEYVLKSNGKCLTDPGNSKNDGTALTLAACKNTANQHWSLP